MREYPSIPNSSKAPHKECIAFDKLDGSNFRAKFTRKKGFALFGTRTQLIDTSTQFWGKMVQAFKKHEDTFIHAFAKKEYRDHREITVFGEFLGRNSFAGRHDVEEEQELVFFDVLVGHKKPKFVLPQDFIRDFAGVPQPSVVYKGKLGPEFIERIRHDKYLREGVICKGTEKVGNAAGGVWMCKIKTLQYFQRLKTTFNEEWIQYWE